jgi:hypothetical protein
MIAMGQLATGQVGRIVETFLRFVHSVPSSFKRALPRASTPYHFAVLSPRQVSTIKVRRTSKHWMKRTRVQGSKVQMQPGFKLHEFGTKKILSRTVNLFLGRGIMMVCPE